MRARDEIVLRDERAPLAMYQPGAAYASSMPPETPEPSLLRGIMRHFWLVIVFAGIGAAGALAFLKYARPMYTSICQITLEPSAGPRQLADILGSTQRSNYLNTQAALMKSGKIFSLIVDKPEIKNLKTWELSHGSAIDYLREEVDTDVDRKTDVISVSISAPYPDEAATIVNAIVRAYTDFQSMEKDTNTSGVLKTFETSCIAAKEQTKQLQAKILNYKRTNPNIEMGDMLKGRVATLLQEYTRAQLNVVELRTRYPSGNPQLQAGLANEAKLYDTYKEALDSYFSTNNQAAEFQQMTTDYLQQKTLSEELEKHIRDLQMAKQQDQVFNTVQVMEPGRVSEKPSFPRKTRTMAVAVVLGGLLGAGLALIRDRSDGRMRSVEEIQSIIGLPILGVVPAMGGRRTPLARAMTVHLDPRSVVSEAYRTIRTAVYFGTNGARCKTILVTSPEPGDGKTTSASNLAIAIAQTGRKVLLLDADFRKPSQHKNLDIKGGLGLSSVLADHEPLEKAIQRTGVDSLDVLPCGPIPANPSEILNSREFGELVDNLAARYDHIVFDSPPVNAVTDARILAAVCDATVLVLRADKSTRKAGEHARNALMAVGGRVLGAIVNDAPNSKAYEAYGGSYYGTPEANTRQSERNGNSQGLGFRRLPTAAADGAD